MEALTYQQYRDAGMLQRERYPTVPAAILDAIDNYVVHHRMPGHFVYYVLADSLSGAVARADEYSMAALAEIVRYVYNEIPRNLWGSEGTVRAWVSQRKATAIAN